MAGRLDGGELVEAEAAAPIQPSRRAWTILGATALGVLAIDLLTKQLVLARLIEGQPVRLLGGVVYLCLTRNSGAAFSIGVGHTAIFPIITMAVVTGIVLLARQLRSLPWALAMGLILGGALGNLTDRLFRAPGPFVGHVVDFISVFDEAGRKFPIFNAADSALVCGVILAVLLELTGRRRDGARVQHSDHGEH